MANPKFETVDAYVAAFPAEVQKKLGQVRAAILKAVPNAEEVISYNVPAIKFHGWIFYYSAYTAHYSLSCPPPFAAFKKFKKELARYEQSKSAVRFPLDEPVPTKLITEMAKIQAKENIAAAKKKKKK